MSAESASPPKPKTERTMLPFEASRRLTGANLFFPATGAQLETAHVMPERALLEGWRARVQRARAHLGWHIPGVVARVHANGASLAIAAPIDALYLATEVNEWALCAALLEQDPARWGGLEAELAATAESAGEPESSGEAQGSSPPVLEESAAFSRFARLASQEARPRLRALLAGAASRHLPYSVDDERLGLGAGAGGRDYSMLELPEVAAVPWGELRDIPTALVTGSNGKTTSVRLLAACAAANGWLPAYCCTDGVFLGRQMLAEGDYSGPLGAREVIGQRTADAAIIETARGGILRRGIGVSQAHAALVTNVSADHFGEYGIDDLDALADVKLTVAGLVPPGGLVVLNADDAQLAAKAAGLSRRFGRPFSFGWFALDADAAPLRTHRAAGGAACGGRAGRLVLTHGGIDHDLGEIASMPLTVEGSATYNIANLAGAALTAAALGIPPGTVAAVFAVFGTKAADNAGRMMRFERAGVQILIDYAHNPEGMKGLLRVAEHLRRGRGRLGTLLGHAGNRQDADIEALSRVTAEFAPALVVVKENEAHLRGRPPGEIPRLIHAALRRAGLPEEALPVRMSEVDAVRCALDWARPGDVLALPVHSAGAREAVLAMLQGSAGC
ncbi:MAG: Mur ligase [Gammaproteobacteria bacterium]|nr:Mur ligase [Gammaproteobacteria bacterium]